MLTDAKESNNTVNHAKTGVNGHTNKSKYTVLDVPPLKFSASSKDINSPNYIPVGTGTSTRSFHIVADTGKAPEVSDIFKILRKMGYEMVYKHIHRVQCELLNEKNRENYFTALTL